MKIKKISQRTEKGWEIRENKQKELCDICGNRLWIGPNGVIYCDHIHSKLSTITQPAYV